MYARPRPLIVAHSNDMVQFSNQKFTFFGRLSSVSIYTFEWVRAGTCCRAKEYTTITHEINKWIRFKCLRLAFNWMPFLFGLKWSERMAHTQRVERKNVYQKDTNASDCPRSRDTKHVLVSVNNLFAHFTVSTHEALCRIAIVKFVIYAEMSNAWFYIFLLTKCLLLQDIQRTLIKKRTSIIVWIYFGGGSWLVRSTIPVVNECLRRNGQKIRWTNKTTSDAACVWWCAPEIKAKHERNNETTINDITWNKSHLIPIGHYIQSAEHGQIGDSTFWLLFPH